MKRYLALPLIAVFMSTAAFAADTHDHKNSDMSKGGMMMGMMSHEQMMAMHDHMEKMQSLMKNIKSEKDPKKRHALLEEHMQAMQDGMHMMNGNMGMSDAKEKMKMIQGNQISSV